MTGGFHFWLKPDTIRLPPWPDKVPPGTAGDRRTLGDVLIYAALIADLLVAVLLPGMHTDALDSLVADNAGLIRPAVVAPLIVLLVVIGLRDKVIFLAARGEQYLPAIVFFTFLPFVDMIVALKLLIVVVWIGAGVSKFGNHFSLVVPPMISNTPWLPSKRIKRAHYRNFPEDLRPSRLGGGVAHVLGTCVEIITPIVLLFSTDRTVTLLAVLLMVAFHLFIASTFPLAVPLEWNLLFAYAAVFLFWGGFPAWDGYGLGDMSSPCWHSASPPRWSSSRSSATCGPTWSPSCHRCVSTPVTGVRDLGLRAGCRGEAEPAHRPGLEEHLHPVARLVPAGRRGRRDAPVARLAFAAQPGPGAGLADDAAPRRRHRHLRRA